MLYEQSIDVRCSSVTCIHEIIYFYMYLKDDSIKIIEKWRTAMLERDIEFCINGHDHLPKGGKSYIKFDIL